MELMLPAVGLTAWGLEYGIETSGPGGVPRIGVSVGAQIEGEDLGLCSGIRASGLAASCNA